MTRIFAWLLCVGGWGIFGLDVGLFSFVFDNMSDRNKVLENGPWSFSRQLLILKPWAPSSSPQNLPFDTCEFWMHIIGLPVEGRKEGVIRSVAEKVGRVERLKIELKGQAGLLICKAKVTLNLRSPLEPGLIYSFRGKELWLDFRYERLPTYCYSCGKIGHYAQNCSDIPYTEDAFGEYGKPLYGSWLRAEMHSPSPFWKSYYEADLEEKGEEETIPETPEHSIMPEKVRDCGTSNPRMEERGKRKMWEVDLQVLEGDSLNVMPATPGTAPLLLALPSFQQRRGPLSFG